VTSSGPLIRPATADDAAAIARIWHAGFIDGHTGHVPEEIWAYRRPADFAARVPGLIELATVAEINGDVVGFAMVQGDEVYQLYVDTSARGTGVAALLLAEGEVQISRAHSVGWLAVVEGNSRARRFYARAGWSEAGAMEQPSYAGAETIMVPALRYEKRLAPVG